MLNPVSEKTKTWKTDVSFLFRLGSQKKSPDWGTQVASGGRRRRRGRLQSPQMALGKSHRMSEDRLIPILLDRNSPYNQWEFQDPKMEVLYHIRSYFVGIFPCNRPYIGLIHGRYLQFRILKFPLIQCLC